jgi:integrase
MRLEDEVKLVATKLHDLRHGAAALLGISDDSAARLTANSGRRLEARWVIALALGLRQGEVLGLRWTDVDLDAGVLRVNRALQKRADGVLTLVEPKTARSRRAVPLPQSVVDTLRTRRSEQDAERARAGALWHDSYGLVFTTAVGTPVHPRNDHLLSAFGEIVWAVYRQPKHL